jgi:hypothetical protein
MSRGPTPVSGSHIRRVGSLLRLDEDKPCVSCVRLNFARNLIEIGLWYSSVVIDIGSASGQSVEMNETKSANTVKFKRFCQDTGKFG